MRRMDFFGGRRGDNFTYLGYKVSVFAIIKSVASGHNILGNSPNSRKQHSWLSEAGSGLDLTNGLLTLDLVY